MSHDKRPRLSEHHPVLVTLRVAPGLRNLRGDHEHQLILCALSEGSERESSRVVEYTVQSSHLHLVVEAQDERAL